MASSDETAATLPRKNLYRASYPAVKMRGEFGTETPPMLTGHFAIFDSPTEIDSMREGNFIEKISKGAFTKTFAENRSNIKVLFQHGRDPQIGDKPLGPIHDLREDDTGAYYEVPLLDTSYNRDLLPALRAGLYGASFRFQVMREDVNKNPGESASNPRGIPERTIREASVGEFSAVTFPAYADATAGIRSITDTISDVDALAYAGAIILDEERMNQSRIFVSRGIDPRKPTLISTKYVPIEPASHRNTADRLRAIISDARAMTDAEPAVMLDGDTVEALGSLIEVCESSLEAMESLLGIDDDTTPDEDDAMGAEMNSAEPVGAVRSDDVLSEEQDAPPSDSAEPSVAHPIRGRRDTHKSYLRKETPSWQL